MSRIDSEKVNLGSSYVISTSDEQMRAQAIVNANTVAGDIINKAQTQSQSIVAETQKKAQKHLEEAIAQAQSQVESIHEEARKQGFEQGYKEGQEAIREALVEQINNLEKFTQSEFEIKKRIIKSAHNDIVNLVIAISDKICKKHLHMDRQVLYNITMNSINALKDKEHVNIIVNPNMAKKIYEISPNLKNDILSLQSIKIVEDASVSEDGTIVESISSRIDNRISSQIDELAQKLLTELQTISEEALVAEIEHKNIQHQGQNG